MEPPLAAGACRAWTRVAVESIGRRLRRGVKATQRYVNTTDG
jgi:hypothetical protein